jgi:hypothetical protein
VLAYARQQDEERGKEMHLPKDLDDEEVVRLAMIASKLEEQNKWAGLDMALLESTTVAQYMAATPPASSVMPWLWEQPPFIVLNDDE